MTATLVPDETGQLEMDLSNEERRELHLCEDVIGRGKQTFFDVGMAFETIREKRLYRATHSNFDAYCREVHGISKTTANRWIQASDTAEEMQQQGVLVENEHQARKLAAMEDTARQEAVEEAKSRAEGSEKPVTAKDVLTAAEELHPAPETVTEATADASTALQTYLSTSGEVVGTTTSPSEEAANSEEADGEDEEPEGDLASAARSQHQSPGTYSPVSSTPSVASTSPSVTVTDKRENRTATSEGTGKEQGTGGTQPSLPASTPAAAPSSPMVFVQLPRHEQTWLNSVGLTAAVALAQLRELRDKGTGYILTPTAQAALTALTDAANKEHSAKRTESDQLEIIIIARARAAGMLADEWEE